MKILLATLLVISVKCEYGELIIVHKNKVLFNDNGVRSSIQISKLFHKLIK